MPKIASIHLKSLVAALALVVMSGLVASSADGARRAAAATQATRMVVKTVTNKTLRKQILVNRKRLTLYSLSAEKNGRFICTDAYCKSLWTPLVVAKGMTPTGAHLLATVTRPDGRTQVTYRGLPL